MRCSMHEGGADRLPLQLPCAVPKLLVRNMVCDRCIAAVRVALDEVGIMPDRVLLGEVELSQTPTAAQRTALRARLAALGFELIDDKRTRTIEQVKGAIRKLVHTDGLERARKEKLSAYLARELGTDYSGLSELFSTVEGLTIERYHILQRLERAKELLVYDELTLGEIADRLGYSSV
ncbi:MAG TPA: AraC family transcriptional regulator, partial [Flavobacteriales bacterium]|nr:AraC family transcriptional regulator [Flavobacteriales bacterium]